MIVFVSDAFKEDYIGGAELTTEAIIEDSLTPVLKIHSQKVTVNLMKKHKDSFWVFGNFAQVDKDLLIYAAKNLDYAVIEYDYKFCKFRSPEKHILAEGSCDCHKDRNGQIAAIFLTKAKTVFWMSHNQRQVYLDMFSFLEESKNVVLSSVFDEPTLAYFKNIQLPEKNNKWLILNSDSWIKGTKDAIEYAKKNNLEFEVIGGLSYGDMLQKLAESKGLIFLPKAGDTCPRLVIEAHLLGCKLILNDWVQHKDEPWFSSLKSTIEYLENRTSVFWQKITELDTKSGMPIIKSKDTKKLHYKIIVPFYNVENWIKKCIKSLKLQNHEDFQCILVDDVSTDNTVKYISQTICGDERFVLIKNTTKKYALENVVQAINESDPKGEDVILILDGDDWLSSTNVLSKLNEVYENEECLLTYGTYIQYPNGSVGVEPSQYPEEVVKNNIFRQDSWRASHLKTFKYSLWKNLNIEDLKDSQGNFYKTAYDQAFMLPLLEMSSERSKYIEDIMYVYNRENPLNVDKTKTKEQYETMLEIRQKPKYNRV